MVPPNRFAFNVCILCLACLYSFSNRRFSFSNRRSRFRRFSSMRCCINVDCASLISVFNVRSCCFVDHDLDLPLALFLVISDEARFCGRNFHDLPETFRPLDLCVDIV